MTATEQARSDLAFASCEVSAWATKRPAPWCFDDWIRRAPPTIEGEETFDEKVKQSRGSSESVVHEVDVYPEGAVCWSMTKPAPVATLNEQVTAAIRELEEAARKVSRLEEEIAKLTSPSSAEGCIARRGAVRAALTGRDEERAKELIDRFRVEVGADKRLIEGLDALFC